VSGLRFTVGDASAYTRLSSERALIANGAFLLATGKKVGETVDLLSASGNLQYRIVAVGNDLLSAKITTAYISQDNLLKDFGGKEDVFIQLNLKKGADRESASPKIRALAADYPQFKVISGADYYASLKSQMTAAFSGLYLMFFVLAVPSLIAMLNTLTIGVIERTREIGMLRAVGATRAQIRALVVAEALLLAAIGTAFGILGGLYLSFVFVSAIEIMFPMGYYFPQSGILAATAIGLLFGVIAALIPAQQAARMNVVEALRYE
jgi:putative ABC transport system permease protein